MKRETYYGIKNDDGTYAQASNMNDRAGIAVAIRETIEREVRALQAGNIHATKGDAITALRFVLADYGA